MNELFAKEEIESFGFIFEPDKSKCKTLKTVFHFDCNYYKDNQWTYSNTPEITSEWKNNCGTELKYAQAKELFQTLGYSS
jgi:hypothetical protein